MASKTTLLSLSWLHSWLHFSPFDILVLCTSSFLPHQPLSRSLNADVPEQLITPLVSLGHISMLAPDQFASPMKSIVANFIVKDLLMNDRVSAAHTHSRMHDCTIQVKTFFAIYLLYSRLEIRMESFGLLMKRCHLKSWLK